ncbi:MAG: alpha/beta hydrolase [Herminiimonas sp.]|nr:alpha/beta hydrolase [Herminiimonas sp.]
MRISRVFIKGIVIIVALQLLVFVAVVALTWAPDRPVSALAPRWAKLPSRFIDVKGLRVHLRDQGQRDDPSPIVLIHGTSDSLHTWEGWVTALKTDRRVITMDLPGFGLTGPNASGNYDGDTYVRFVVDLLDALGVQRCVLGGNSLGGDIAWHVALAAPQRVDRLILVDAGGYPVQAQSVPIGFRVARMPGLNRLMEYTLPRTLIASSVRNVYGDPERVTPELVDRYEELTLREGNRRALGQRFAHAAFGADAARISQIRIPTLILWGGRDKLIPVENARRFQQDIAGSTLQIFDELGHVPHEENAVATVKAVQDFLQR